MKATRRAFTYDRGETRIRVESETVRHTFLDHLLGRRRPPAEQVVLNGPWWSLQTRAGGGYRYERLREATRAELIEFAHLNINPHTAAWALASGKIDPVTATSMSTVLQELPR